MKQLPHETDEAFLERYAICLRQLRYEAELAGYAVRRANANLKRALRTGSPALMTTRTREAAEAVRQLGRARGWIDIAEAVIYARTRRLERSR